MRYINLRFTYLLTYLPAKFRLDRFILSSCGGEKPQFLPFFGLRHLLMSPVGINLRKLSTVHNCKLPLSNGIKIVSVLQRLHDEIGRTNSDVQKRDGQTDKKTRRFWPPQGRVKYEPHQTWRVIENLEHVLAPPKLFGFDA